MTLLHSPSNATEPMPAALPEPRPAPRVHPFHALEQRARAELMAMSVMSAPPRPGGSGHELLAALGWDLGLSGDELP